MKIRITDLMDYYRGEPVKMTPPEGRPAAHGGTWPSGRSMHRMRRPLLAASVLVLITAGAFALRLGLGRAPAGGDALNEGEISVESAEDRTVETLPPELPAQVPVLPAESAVEEPVPDTVQEPPEPQAGIAPIVLDGIQMRGFCYGNLLWVDGSYYTMTEAGPEPAEVQELNETVELYGTWNVKIAYAVIDGELAFRDLGNLEEPGDALAYPVPGSPDTVMLEVFRTDANQVERCAYKFFYNVFTGEISDPLGNVPELFSYGDLANAKFNDTHTWAILAIYRVEEEGYTSGMDEYLCNLTTGEMELVSNVAELYLFPESTVSMSGEYWWAEGDNLLLWMSESQNGSTHHWLLSWNAAAGTLNYKLQGMAFDLMNRPIGSSGDFSFRHLHTYAYNSEDYQIINTADGTSYQFPEGSFQDMWGDDSDASGSRVILRDDDDETLYLLDDDHLGWVKLNDWLDQIPGDVAFVRFVTEDWLCLNSSQGIFCYHIPEDLPWTPYIAN